MTILETLRNDQRAAADKARHTRNSLATKVRAGLRAEARLVAAQAAEYGLAEATKLAAKRTKDRAQVLAAVISEVAS